MSYDVTLEIDTGGAEPFEVYDVNHTSNTSAMWREAGCDLAAFDGQPAAQLAPAIGLALQLMRDQPARFRAMNPPNGWGTYETCVAFLTDIEAACRAHPLTTVRVSR